MDYVCPWALFQQMARRFRVRIDILAEVPQARNQPHKSGMKLSEVLRSCSHRASAMYQKDPSFWRWGFEGNSGDDEEIVGLPPVIVERQAEPVGA